jgi:hypothetical protein
MVMAHMQKSKKNSQEGSRENNIALFPVSEQPFEVNGHQATGFKAIVNDMSGKTIAVVSDKYKLVKNDQIADHFETLLDAVGIKYQYGKGMVTNGFKTAWEMILPEMKLKLPKMKGDEQGMDFRLYIFNNLGGTGSVRNEFGFFRHKCLNRALMVGRADVDFRLRHVGEVNERIKEAFEIYVNSRFQEANDTLRRLGEGAFRGRDEVVAAIEDVGFMSKKGKESAVGIWQKDYEGSLGFWPTYNALTQELTHGGNINDYARVGALSQLAQHVEKKWFEDDSLILPPEEFTNDLEA